MLYGQSKSAGSCGHFKFHTKRDATKGEDPKQIAERIGVGLLLGASVKSALDIADWTNQSQKGDALTRLLDAIATLEEWVREEIGERAGKTPVAEKLATLAQLPERDLAPD